MAHLGGEFAMLALVSVAENALPGLEKDLQKIRKEGYQITFLETKDNHVDKYAGWLPYEIEVLGADHEGIIHKVAQYLATQGINIEEIETTTAPAPMSGTPLFMMQATVLVPPKLPFHEWSEALDDIGDKLNVYIKVSLTQ